MARLRPLLVALVLGVALVLTLTVTPTVAAKPLNYGDCLSAVATGNFFSPDTTVQEFTESTAPSRAFDAARFPPGLAGQQPINCVNFPPPSN
jgi:hypothetical protein